MNSYLKYKCVGSVVLIPCEIIDPNPYIIKTKIESSFIDELAISIKNIGIIQPLLVRKIDCRYQIVSGEKRLRAAVQADMSVVPCIIINISDLQVAVFTLSDIINRKNINYFEIAQLIHSIIKNFNISVELLSQLIGVKVDYIYDKLKLLSLSDNIKHLINVNFLSEEYAKALLKIKNECSQINALEYFISNKISVEQIENYINLLLSPAMLTAKTKIIKLKDIKIFINTFNHAVDTMQKAGIDAVAEQHDFNDCIEYVVRIPKKTTSPVNFTEYIGSA